MIFKTTTNEIKNAIKNFKKFVNKKGEFEAFRYIKFTIEDGKIILSSYNFDYSLQYDIVGEIVIAGDGFCLDYFELENIFKAMPSDIDVTFWIETVDFQEKVKIRSEVSNIVMDFLAPGKFSMFKNTDIKRQWDFDIADFVEAMKRIEYATADSEVRPMLSGIKIQVAGDKIIFVGTNSFVLWEFIQDNKYNNSDDIILFPNKTARAIIEIIKINKIKNENIIFSIGEDNDIKINVGKYKIQSRLLAGAFPKYEDFFPKTHNVKIAVNKKELENVLKSMKTATKNNKYNTRFICVDENTLEINDSKSFSFKLPSTISLNGDDTIGLNCEYVLDFVKSIDSEVVFIEYKNYLSPIIFTDGSGNHRHLIMPLKI